MKTTTHTIRLLFVVLIGMLPAFASAQTIEWIKQTGTSGDDYAYKVVADGLGNVYISGWTEGDLAATNMGKEDAFISKYDASGTCLWTQQFGTSELDRASGLVLDGLGHVYISGWTEGNLAGGSASTDDVFLSKYDVDGNHVWTKQPETVYDENVTGMAIDGSGNLYITGMQDSNFFDTFLSKYDASGNHIWTQPWGYAGLDISLDVAVDNSDNVYITGVTQGSNPGDSDIFLRKYDPNGGLIWQKETGTSVGDASYGLAIDASDNVYITGETSGNLAGSQTGDGDAFARKYNENGQLLWNKQWGTDEYDTGHGMSIDDAGNLFLVGITEGDLAGTNPDGLDLFVQKYDNTGALEWTEQIGSLDDAESVRLSVDNLGNVYFSGYTRGNLGGDNQGDQDLFLGKITEVPEPSTLLLVLMGVVTLALTAGRRR